MKNTTTLKYRDGLIKEINQAKVKKEFSTLSDLLKEKMQTERKFLKKMKVKNEKIHNHN